MEEQESERLGSYAARRWCPATRYGRRPGEHSTSPPRRHERRDDGKERSSHACDLRHPREHAPDSPPRGRPVPLPRIPERRDRPAACPESPPPRAPGISVRPRYLWNIQAGGLHDTTSSLQDSGDGTPRRSALRPPLSTQPTSLSLSLRCADSPRTSRPPRRRRRVLRLLRSLRTTRAPTPLSGRSADRRVLVRRSPPVDRPAPSPRAPRHSLLVAPRLVLCPRDRLCHRLKGGQRLVSR